MATIRQVADKAGVSIGTVSRVLNHKTGVGDRTRRHVFDVADKLGYTIPNRLNRPILDVTHLGMLYHPMYGDLTNPFYQNVFMGVEQACREQHINLSFNALDMSTVSSTRLNSLPPLLASNDLSGIVLVGALPEAVVTTLMASCQLPFVLVDNDLPDSDSVMIDNIRGTELVMERLISLGHRHIALMSGPNRPSIVERRIGYETSLAQHGLPAIMVSPCDLMPDEAEIGILQILEQAPHITAVVCSNDLQAVTVIKVLQRLGYCIPEDISVTGFDDINMAAFSSPPLTTVHVDRIALGQIAADVLLGRIRNPARPASKTVMGVRLIERGSVCKVRSRQAIGEVA